MNKTALEVNSDLLPWIQTWFNTPYDVEVLDPKGWFLRGHDIFGFQKNLDGLTQPVLKPGAFIWAPPPAAAEVAIEELRKARHKRQLSYHLFVCPKLMKYNWIGQLFKGADLVAEVKAQNFYWSANQHESLIIGFFFPFISHRPWQLRRSPFLLDVGRLLQRVWREKQGSEGSILQQLFIQERTLASLSQHMVWKMLQSRFECEFLHSETGKRRRQCLEEENDMQGFSGSKKRRLSASTFSV